MKRRTFIEHSAIAGSGLVLTPQLAGMAKRISTNEKVGLGVIGTGDRGRGLINIMKQFPQFNIASIADVLPFRLSEALEDAGPNTTAHEDYRRILDDKNVDAVIIATPLSMHFEMANAALEAGKHVYCEKTMTFHIDEALNLVGEAESRGNQVFQVGHQYRYHPLYFKVADLIRKDLIGDVTNIYVQWNRNGDWRRPVPSPEYERLINWRMYREYSGGLTAELLGHQIDYINWIFNTHPEQIAGFGGIDYWKDGRETFDNVNTIFKYPGGMKVNLISLTANGRNDFMIEFRGSKGTIQMDYTNAKIFWEPLNDKTKGTVDGVSGATMQVNDSGEGSPIWVGGLKDGWDGSHYALEEFYNCIIDGGTPISNVYTGAKTAICVRLAVDAMVKEEMQFWDERFNV